MSTRNIAARAETSSSCCLYVCVVKVAEFWDRLI